MGPAPEVCRDKTGSPLEQGGSCLGHGLQGCQCTSPAGTEQLSLSVMQDAHELWPKCWGAEAGPTRNAEGHSILERGLM